MQIKDDDSVSLSANSVKVLSLDNEEVQEVQEEKKDAPKRVYVKADENLSLNENERIIRELIGSSKVGKDAVSYKYKGKVYLIPNLKFTFDDVIKTKLESRFDQIFVKEMIEI